LVWTAPGFRMKELQQIVAVLETAPPNGGALATLVAIAGSSYRRAGARALFTGDGRRVGSISGGCLEDDVAVHAQAVVANGTPEVISYDTTSENDLLWGVGLGCHGVVQVLIERLPPLPRWVGVLRENLRRRRPTELAVVWRCPDQGLLGTRLATEPAPPAGASVFRETISPPVSLAVFGAGDDAQPLVRLARELGWQVTVADPRPAYATSARFPDADAVVLARPEEAPGRMVLDAGTVAVVMTHHYAHDVPLLRQLLSYPLAYLGLLGPKKRAERILADLAAGGLALTEEMRRRLHAPVGLDLGADNPEEVALAILAEMKAALAGRDARPLRERQKPIHG